MTYTSVHGWQATGRASLTHGAAWWRMPAADAGTAAVGAVVHLLATAIEEGRDLSSMSGILAVSSYRLLPA
jgi:hypothetical protein